MKVQESFPQHPSPSRPLHQSFRLFRDYILLIYAKARAKPKQLPLIPQLDPKDISAKWIL
jgi:hypothetical protein